VVPACAGRELADNMIYVYLLKSIKNDWFYVGLSSDVHRRLKEHNDGHQKSTKFYKPFKLIYTKEFQTIADARDYEKYLKISSNKEKLIKSLNI